MLIPYSRLATIRIESQTKIRDAELFILDALVQLSELNLKLSEAVSDFLVTFSAFYSFYFKTKQHKGRPNNGVYRAPKYGKRIKRLF